MLSDTHGPVSFLFGSRRPFLPPLHPFQKDNKDVGLERPCLIQHGHKSQASLLRNEMRYFLYFFIFLMLRVRVRVRRQNSKDSSVLVCL